MVVVLSDCALIEAGDGALGELGRNYWPIKGKVSYLFQKFS
jgi:hypothetical protein